MCVWGGGGGGDVLDCEVCCCPRIYFWELRKQSNRQKSVFKIPLSIQAAECHFQRWVVQFNRYLASWIHFFLVLRLIYVQETHCACKNLTQITVNLCREMWTATPIQHDFLFFFIVVMACFFRLLTESIYHQISHGFTLVISIQRAEPFSTWCFHHLIFGTDSMLFHIATEDIYHQSSCDVTLCFEFALATSHLLYS